MADVAKLLGKRFNERFTVIFRGCRYDVKLSPTGLDTYYDFIDFEDAIDAMILRDLLTGEHLASPKTSPDLAKTLLSIA